MAPPDELHQSYTRYNFAIIGGKFECPGFLPVENPGKHNGGFNFEKNSVAF